MPKLRELIQTPPEPEGGAEEQLEALRDYLRKVTQELEYLLTHLEADNINDTTFERISEMIPRPYTGLPLMDGEGSAGTSAAWSRGNHRHPHDDTKADVTALENHKADKANPHEVTKAQVGLGNVANERQYSVQNPPPIPTPGEVGAVPVTREINGHALSADVTLDHTDVGAIPTTDKGSAGGVAELDSSGMVPSSQLPSYVDDVLEYASLSLFPAVGESGKIYVALDTGRTYRWSGSAYVEISESLALGETSSTAYRGDRGKTAYDHSQTTGNPHGTTAAEVGARPDTWTPSAADVGARPDTWTPTAADVGARPDTWTPSAADVGAVPTTRTINGYDLSQDRSLDASDVGARPDDWVPDAEDVPYDNTQSGLTATDVQSAIDELAQGGGGGGPSPSASNPEMDGTAAPGTALTYARGDHVHPTDTTRAAAALEINGHPLTGDFDLTAADVGALASGGTAVAAGKLANAHSITTSDAGWYKFLTITMEAYTRQTMIIAVENRYNSGCGLLRIHTRRNSYGGASAAIGWISAGSETVDVRWEYADGTWSFYAYKSADPAGLYFQVLSKTDDSYGTWLSTLVEEPTTATDASDTVALMARSGLWFTSVAVSAGTAQQIITISDAAITTDYVLVRIEWADPSYITAGYTWTTAAGSFTLSGTATAATTANILLVRKGN